MTNPTTAGPPVGPLAHPDRTAPDLAGGSSHHVRAMGPPASDTGCEPGPPYHCLGSRRGPSSTCTGLIPGRGGPVSVRQRTSPRAPRPMVVGRCHGRCRLAAPRARPPRCRHDRDQQRGPLRQRRWQPHRQPLPAVAHAAAHRAAHGNAPADIGSNPDPQAFADTHAETVRDPVTDTQAHGQPDPEAEPDSRAHPAPIGAAIFDGVTGPDLFGRRDVRARFRRNRQPIVKRRGRGHGRRRPGARGWL